MSNKQEQALNVLTRWAWEATLGMAREEAAEFFDRLADWVYARHEACLTDPEPERITRKNNQPDFNNHQILPQWEKEKRK